jgi:hypothetical protein
MGLQLSISSPVAPYLDPDSLDLAALPFSKEYLW